MKLFAIFITLLMLATGFDFCTDAGGADSSQTTLNAKDKPNTPELCSPFCQCARCPFSVLLPKPLAETTAICFINSDFISPSIGEAIRVNSSIWQPPRFS